MFDLSLEQQFNISAFNQQTQNMSREQAIEMLQELYRQVLLRENSYKTLLRQQWGMGSATAPHPEDLIS